MVPPTPARPPDDRDARERRALQLAIGFGLAGFLLMAARIATGDEVFLTGLFATAFLGLSGGAFVMLRRKAWRDWTPRPVPRRKAMAVFAFAGSSPVALYSLFVLVDLVAHPELGWEQAAGMLLFGVVLIPVAFYAAYRSLGRRGLLV